MLFPSCLCHCLCLIFSSTCIYFKGLLGQIHDKLKSSNPFAFGDGADTTTRNNFQEFLNKINQMRSGLEPFTLVIEDPMDHSFIYSPASDGFEDDDLIEEQYIRTEEENEEFGLNDMITEDYNQDGKVLPSIDEEREHDGSDDR